MCGRADLAAEPGMVKPLNLVKVFRKRQEQTEKQKIKEECMTMRTERSSGEEEKKQSETIKCNM